MKSSRISLIEVYRNLHWYWQVIGVALLAVFSNTVGAQQDPPPAAAPTVPVFVDGEAQIVPGFRNRNEWIRHDLFVETEFDSDGDGKLDRVHVAVTRPKQTDTEGLKVAVIYNTSPYFAGTGSTAKEHFWNPRQELGDPPPPREDPPAIGHRSLRPVISNAYVDEWVPRGFAVVHSESPGTGLSQGCPTVGGPNESLAPKAVIDWLNGRAKGYKELDTDEEVIAYWCTGKVGMIGTSYEGTLPLAAATTGVEGLECIIPIAPNTSYYHYYRSYGLIRHPGGWMGEDIDVLFDFINSGHPDRRDHCICAVRDKELRGNFDRVSGNYNDFWAGRDYLNQLDKLTAATLMCHAFNDWNVMPEHSYRIYQALKEKGVPAQIYYHQGGHGGDPPLTMKNRWFSRYLYGIQNGVENDSRAWIVRETARRSEPTSYPDYPHPDAAPVTFFLHPGGNQSGGLRLVPHDDTCQEKLVDDFTIAGADLAQAATSDHRLLYVTEPLTDDLHLSGVPQLTIRLACDRPACNLSVWLVSLPWTQSRRITDNIITRGWANPQNYRSLRESELLEPGRFYELTFDLQPDDQVIPAGQQIGLMIFSSDYDFTLWPEPGTALTVDLSGTRLELPIVGGAASLSRPTGK